MTDNTISKRIERAERSASLSFDIAVDAGDEARACLSLGLKTRQAECEDRAKRHREQARVQRAIANTLRDSDCSRYAQGRERAVDVY